MPSNGVETLDNMIGSAIASIVRWLSVLWLWWVLSGIMNGGNGAWPDGAGRLASWL